MIISNNALGSTNNSRIHREFSWGKLLKKKGPKRIRIETNLREDD
jgi:hypothetical protein